MPTDLFHETTARTVDAGYPSAVAREITIAGVAAVIVLAAVLASSTRAPAPESTGPGSAVATVRR